MSASTTSLETQCAVCSSLYNLQRRGKCKIQLYCSRDHQVFDRDTHKAACNAIAKKRTTIETEEPKLRDHPSDFMMRPNPFKHSVDHFWAILETETYIRIKFAFVEAMQKVKTRASIEAQRDNLFDMLRLCQGDNMGVRYLIPSLLLHLGQDQEAYDFIKGHETEGQRGDYDWGDMSLPYLDIKNADVFEPVDYICHRFPQLKFVVAVTLLKIRLFLDLNQIQGHVIPNRTRDPAQLRSGVLAQRDENLKALDHNALTDTLAVQIKKLYETVNNANKYLWPALQNPDEHVNARPNACSAGTKQEMQIALMYAYEAWRDTRGAIEYIRDMS